MEKNINVKIMAVFATVLLLVIVITASFAYFGSFNVNLNNNVAVNINAVSPGDATFISKGAILNLQVPAVNMSQTNAGTLASSSNATLTVELTGSPNLSTTCIYDVVYEYDTNSNVYGTSPTTKNGDKEITLEVTSPNGTNNFSIEKNFDSSTIASYKSGNTYTLVSGVSIVSTGTKTSQNINITARYYNLNASQDNLASKAFTGKIYAVKKNCETGEIPTIAKDVILLYNGGETVIKAKGKPDFSTVATTNEGMYAAEDDLGTSYYFRGAVDNNWVKFGKDSSGNGIYWRIIRINGDGSIRMVYTGTTAPTESTKVIMTGEGTAIGRSAFNSSSNSSEYVGYMYTVGQQHGTGTSSTIKTTIDNWYKTTTLETVVLLSHKKPDGHINVKVEFGEGEGKVPLDNIAKRAESYKPKERVTYKMIKEYIEAKYGFKVHTAYIAEVKRDLGLPMYDAPNAVEELKQPRKHPTPEKVEAIKDALKHFEVI